MRTALLVVLLSALPVPVPAESLVAARTLPARTVVGEGDVVTVDADIPGALRTPDEAAGQETRVAIYAGRPVRATDLGPPALVERNGRALLIYSAGGLLIRAEGRALDRGGEGDPVRAMNLSSRVTVTGIVGADGAIHLGGRP